MNFLKRLFGKKEQVALELPLEFLQAEPPDWLLELKVTYQPDGRGFAVKAGLRAETRTGSVTVEIDVVTGGDAAQKAAGDLSQVEAGRLLVLLGFSFPDDIGFVGPEYTDGIPAKLSVHQREPYSLKEGDCNLMHWLNSKQSQPPTVEITKILVEVKNRLSQQQ